MLIFFFKQKSAYEIRISGWSSDVCSSDLTGGHREHVLHRAAQLGAEHVIAGVGAERRPVQGFRHPGGEAVIEAMYGYRGRQRSEERRVGKEGGSTCSNRWLPDH